MWKTLEQLCISEITLFTMMVTTQGVWSLENVVGGWRIEIQKLLGCGWYALGVVKMTPVTAFESSSQPPVTFYGGDVVAQTVEGRTLSTVFENRRVCRRQSEMGGSQLFRSFTR